MAARFLGSEELEGPNHPEITRNCRQEARVEDCHTCAYEFYENGEETAPAVRQGQVFTLNRSAHGVLLLMGEVPRVDQLIQVYNVRLGWRRSTMIYHGAMDAFNACLVPERIVSGGMQIGYRSNAVAAHPGSSPRTALCSRPSH